MNVLYFYFEICKHVVVIQYSISCSNNNLFYVQLSPEDLPSYLQGAKPFHQHS